MPKNYNKKVLLAKLESTYGSDASPQAADAILLSDVTITPMDADIQERGLVTAALGSQAKSVNNPRPAIEFTVELAGAGTPGTVPGYGALLRGCGFAEVIDAGKSVSYKPVSSNFESLSLYFNMDGTAHKLLGARGNVSFSIKAGEIPTMKFAYTGMWADPSDISLPQADTNAFKIPTFAGNSTTEQLSIHGYTAVLASLNIDMKNNVIYRHLIGSESVEITDRGAEGSVSIEAPSLTSKDFFAAAKQGGLAPLTLTHGKTDGHIAQITAPKVQVLAPKYSDSDGVAMLDIDIVVTPDEGDDELTLTIK
ncbi:MAG: phage tail tube protein [Pseudomonadota bacterium]